MVQEPMNLAGALARELGLSQGNHLDLVDLLPRELSAPDLGVALLDTLSEMADDDRWRFGAHHD